jgi:hypothetical protein
MLRRPQAYPGFPQRRSYDGPLDLRAPEDQAATQSPHDDGEIWTPAIRQAMTELDRATDFRDLQRAASGVVEAMSGYNKMSGIPIFAGRVVPPQLLRKALPPGADTPRAAERFVQMFDEHVQPMLRQEVGRHVAANAAGLPPLPREKPVQDAPGRPGPATARPDEVDDTQGWTLRDARPRPKPSPFAPPLSLRPSILPDPPAQANAGDRSWIEPMFDAPLNPKKPSVGKFAPHPDVRQPPEGFEYETWRPKFEDWRAGRGARVFSDGGSTLVDRSMLTKAQQDLLNDRHWIHPTGIRTGANPLGGGHGFFGASREGKQGARHGGLDAPIVPYGEKISSPDRSVNLPTGAKFVDFREVSSGGDVINKFIFDIGQGISVEILHVKPSAKMQKLIDTHQYGGTFDAGELLGDVDAKHDHAHVQIIATGPNRERWAVDPTPYLEPEAPELLRRSLKGLSKPAYDWLMRQIK